MSTDTVEIEVEAKPLARQKPDISHLEMAIEIDDEGNVTFLPEVGEKVVIERYATLLGEGAPWLDTCLYTIKSIDRETGALRLWHDELGNFAASNYIEGTLMGYSFRLPPKKGPITKRKVRVKRVVRDTVEEAPVSLYRKGSAGEAMAERKGKGRPKGVRNRPKEVIAAEKAAKKANRK